MKKYYRITAMVLATVFATGTFLSYDVGYAAKKGKLYFSKSVKTLSVGNSYNFRVSGEKRQAEDTIIWSSSNPKIAKVNKKGKVTAIKKGTVIIMAKIEKSRKSVKQKLKVTKKVEKPIEKEQEDIENKIENPEIPSNDEDLIYNIGDQGKEKEEEPYKEQEVENDLVTNLSKEVEKIDVGRNDILFTDYKDVNQFCYSVFNHVVSKKEKDQNPVVSPLSAYLALVLAAEGAKENTKTEFDAVLGKDSVAGRVYQLTESLSKVSGSTKLSIADSVWMDDTFAAEPAWLSNMVNLYNAEIYQTDLCTDKARIGINHWVGNKTQGLIPTLLEKNLSEDARLALINAIYLKAKWRYPFEERSTYKREFTNEDGKKVMTDFMNDGGYRSYFKTEDADGLILPYDDGRLSFFAIRPQAGQTARQLAQSLTREKLHSYLKNAVNTDVILHLPKFTIDYSITMNDILKTMGLQDAFDEEKANLKGLGHGTQITDQNLYISQVLQKVKVKVAEEGTEAAAVTAVIVADSASAIVEEKTPLEIDFHEPFVYIIADTQTLGEETETVPLFLGIVTEFSE